MFGIYTERCQKAVLASKNIAKEMESPLVRPEHLLLAILKERNSPAITMLKSQVKLADFRKQVAEQLKKDGPDFETIDFTRGKPEGPMLSFSVGQTITEAIFQASSEKSEKIDTTHILLALVKRDKTGLFEGMTFDVHTVNVKEAVEEVSEEITIKDSLDFINELQQQVDSQIQVFSQTKMFVDGLQASTIVVSEYLKKLEVAIVDIAAICDMDGTPKKKVEDIKKLLETL